MFASRISRKEPQAGKRFHEKLGLDLGVGFWEASGIRIGIGVLQPSNLARPPSLALSARAQCSHAGI